MEQSLPSTLTSLVGEGRRVYKQAGRCVTVPADLAADVKPAQLPRERQNQGWDAPSSSPSPSEGNSDPSTEHQSKAIEITHKRFLTNQEVFTRLIFFPKRIKNLATLEIPSPLAVLVRIISSFEWILSVLTVYHPNFKRKTTNKRFNAVKM